jgi:hypothetical protein
MKTKVLFSIFILFAAFYSCKKDSGIKNNNNNNNVTDSCGALQNYDNKDSGANRYDAFRISTATISGDYLKLTVTYGGGCQPHDFKLVWNQMAMGPYNRIFLTHDAHGDLCKALVTRKLCFNLSLLKGVNSHGESSFPLSDSYGNALWLTYKY